MLFHDGVGQGHLNPFADPRRLLPVTCLSQAICVLAFHQQRLSVNVFFITIIGLQTITTWLSMRVALSGLNLQISSKKKLAASAAISCVLYGFLAWPVRNFYSTESLLIGAALFQSAIHGVGLLGVAAWYCIPSSNRLDPSSIRQSLQLRTAQNNGRISPFYLTILAGFAQATGIVGSLLSIHSFATGYPDIVAVTVQILFIPAMIDAWADISEMGIDQERLREISKLTVRSARQMLSRHSRKNDNWATIVGLKTANITIEHDVENTLSTQLPSTLHRIRSNETTSFVKTLISNSALSIQSMSEKIACTIDPELSQRPCLDALRLCSTLYLDAGALLERRIAGLTNLFPIINPGLANALNRNQAIAALKRTRWFFYFDYNWIDQSIVNTATESSYTVQVDRISPQLRLAMIQHMEKTHGVGSYIWLGQQAYERLLREAPILMTIIEPHLLTLPGDTEQLVFAIKFEQLVPRLQRYYALDELRSKIIDYEPSPNAQKLLNILSLQINNATREVDILRTVDAVSSYRWHGFKEKDQALQLLLKVHNKFDEQPDRLELSEQVKRRLQEKILLAISAVGYPSQLMNQGHLYKLELRNLTHIKNTALDPTNPKCLEAWVTLSNIDYKKLSPHDLTIVVDIIRLAIKRSNIIVDPNVHARVLDCCTALLQKELNLGDAAAVKLLLSAIDAILLLRPQPESASLIIDTITFIEQLRGEPITLSKRAENYFEELSRFKGKSTDSWQQALASRWLDFKSNKRNFTQGEIAS